MLEYQVRATGKLYHHKMRLGAALSLSRDPAHLLAHLKLKHPAYFATAALKDAQLLKLIHKILARLPPQDPP